MTKRKPTLWGGYTQVKNATFQVGKGQKYGVFFPKATVPYIRTTDQEYALSVARNFKGAKVRRTI